MPTHPKDERVIKVEREKMKEPVGRSRYAASLIKNGIAPRDVPLLMQVGDRIISGASLFPSEYHTLLPERLWVTGSKALTQWFKEVLPESVFESDRAIIHNLPSRFDIEGAINSHIAKKVREKAPK